MKAPVATPEPSAVAPESPREVGDIRRSKPYVLARAPRRWFLLRAASVCVLIFLDLCGLALALYGALALREEYYGNTPILWGVLWDAEGEWLPFVALVTVLVFSQARLYASREHRSGFGRVVSSLLLVALLTFAFGLGTGHEFSTFGLIPTTLVLTAVLIGLFRASYDVVTREMFHAFGVHRRAVLAGEGEHLLELYRTLGSGRGGIDYELVGLVSASEPDVPLAVLGSADTLRAVLESNQVDELIVTDSDFDERRAARHGRPSASCRGPGANRAEDDGASDEARGLRSGPGDPAVRDPAAGARRLRLGAQAGLRHDRVRRRPPDRPADLARDRGRREAQLARARASTATAGSGSESASSRC